VSAIEDLLETMARLRAPNGCPWDREQDHQSIAECLIDECSELLETIDNLDMDHMKEELGDVLLQVVFHSQLAKESEHFDFDAVVREVNDKLVRRHPHVFGESSAEDSEQALHQWEEIKAKEKKNGPQSESVFKNLPPSLPALMYAVDIYKQIQKQDLPTGPLVDKASIETLSNSIDEETAGALLFEIAAACRRKGVDPESSLRRYARAAKSETEALASQALS
jgi:MazG family protein